MKKNEPVSTIMTTRPIAVTPADKPSRVRRILEEYNIHHIPVTEGTRLVGIISTVDLLRVSFGDFGNQDSRTLDTMLDHSFTIADLMSPDPVTIGARDPIRDAAQLLSTGRFHSLPVVDDDALVGIVTSSDLIRYLLDQY